MMCFFFLRFVMDVQDQYDNIAAHTHKGIEFLERYRSFVQDRCSIELDYASKLRSVPSFFFNLISYCHRTRPTD